MSARRQALLAGFPTVASRADGSLDCWAVPATGDASHDGAVGARLALATHQYLCRYPESWDVLGEILVAVRGDLPMGQAFLETLWNALFSTAGPDSW